jgi:hypothetical protein
MKSTLIISLIFLFVFPLGLKSQSVFAPIVGAEWRYFFETNDYNTNIPFRKSRRGLLKIKYDKDTFIAGIKVKKFEQTELFTYKGDNIIYNLSKRPFFMSQKSDSVLSHFKDSTTLAFAYKKGLSKDTTYTIYKNNIKLNLKLLDSKDTFFQVNGYKFKKYAYKSIASVIDLYFEDTLVVLDRIGAINADLSIFQSQLVGSNEADIYSLVCYKDNEIGEFKFSNKNCENLVSIFELNVAKDFDISISTDFIEVSIKNKVIDNIRIYDLQGKLIKIHSNNNEANCVISKNDLPYEVLILSVQDKSLDYYNSKKIFIH